MSISLSNNPLLQAHLERAQKLLNPLFFYTQYEKSLSQFDPISESVSLIQCFEKEGEGIKPIDFTGMDTIPLKLVIKVPKELIETGKTITHAALDKPEEALKILYTACYTFPDIEENHQTLDDSLEEALSLADGSLQSHINQTCAKDGMKITQCDTCIHRANAQVILSDYFTNEASILEQHDSQKDFTETLKKIVYITRECFKQRAQKWEPSEPPSSTQTPRPPSKATGSSGGSTPIPIPILIIKV